MKSKIVSLICILALILSMCSFVTVFAAQEVKIITAQFMPYEGQIKVLASLTEGYSEAKVYVNDNFVETSAITQTDGDVVFISSFTPTNYGIVTIKLEATVDGALYYDTQNVKIDKVTSKAEKFSENFNRLSSMEMENSADSIVTNLLTASTEIAFGSTMPNNANGANVNVKNNYGGMTNDDKSLVFELPKTSTSSLPTIYADPDNLTSGVAEFSFDMFGSKAGARISLRVEATTGTYTYNSLMYPRALNEKGISIHGGAYYVKHHDYNTYAFSNKQFETNEWHNVRFLIDFDELTYVYYVDDEKMDFGTIVGSSEATVGYKRVLFQIGCVGEDVEIALDDISIKHLTIVAAQKSKEKDITSALSFDNTSDSAGISVTPQNSTTVAKKVETVDSESALSFYYTEPATSTKALKGQKTFFAIHSFDEEKTGRIVLEHDLYIPDGNATLNYELNGYSGTTKQTFYPLQDNSLFANGKISTTTCDYSNGWNKVKIVIDFEKNRTEVYFNDILIDSSDYLLTGNNPGSGTEVGGFYAARINYSPSTEPTLGEETFGFAVDNWRVYKELPIPEIADVAGYDISGNSAAVVNTGVVSADTDKFELNLTNTEYCNQASLESNAMVLADGVEVQDAVSLSDGTLTIDVSNVPEHADLQLVIGKDTLLYDGTTTIGADTVFNLKTANENGIYIKRAVSADTSNVNVNCGLDVLSGSKNVVVVLALYDDDELVGITSKTVTLTGLKSLSLALPTSDATSVKVFVWDNLESGAAPYDSEAIYSIASQN